MRITEHQAGSVTVLRVTGRLTLSEGAGRVKEKLGSVLAEGHRHVVLNMGGVTYVDSSWLGELVASHKAAVDHGAIVRLATAGPRLQQLIELTKLDSVFDIHDTEAAAIESFAVTV
jgi:anti-sigma B factor antagonist